MESRRINTELSRAMNGNLSSAWTGWEGNIIYIRSAIQAVEGAEAPRQAREPIYELLFSDRIYNNLTYRDLSTFPSVIRFGAILKPADYDRFVVSAGSRFDGQVRAFGWWDGSAFELMESGTSVVIDSADQYGEYRVQKVLNPLDAYLVPSTANPTEKESGTSATYVYEEGASFFVVDLSSDAYDTGDYFVSKDPVCGGQIYAKSQNRYFIQPGFGNLFPPFTHETGEPEASGAMRDWKIDVSRTVSLFRSLQVALYDLTLAYTLRLPMNIDPDDVRIEILDETDSVAGTIPPVVIDGSAKYMQETIANTSYVRIIQRFLVETKYPYYGRARIKFDRSTGSQSKMSNVTLYRGNYTEKILSGSTEKTDFVESHIDVNSEIVPRGTIVAYAGGSVCPPGYERAEGVGFFDASFTKARIGQGKALRSYVGRVKDMILEVEFDARTSRGGITDPRTILRIDRDVVDRTSFAGALTYQKSRRLVNVVPFRYSSNHHLWDDLIRQRTDIGDPHLVWVTDQYDRTDIQPGCILEIQWNQKRYFMIVSQYAQGRFISEFHEAEPQYPFGKHATEYGETSDDLRRAIRQVGSGMGRNSVYQGYRIYGDFVPQYEIRGLMELVGDWTWLLNAIRTDVTAEAFVWKSGIVAHAQTHPELGDDDDYGGYGYWGEPHSHYLAQSTSTGLLLDNLGPGDPTYPIKVPTKHRHGFLFGAATLPKVRPVLLCQKI